MKKIYPYVAGNTLKSHKKFIRKLTIKGAKVVKSPQKSDVTIVFCPIISRFQTDIDSALSRALDLGCDKVILVAMHHTFDENYTLPNHREMSNRAVLLLVNCLFFEDGLLNCSCNKNAVKMVRKELGLGCLTCVT